MSDYDLCGEFCRHNNTVIVHIFLAVPRFVAGDEYEKRFASTRSIDRIDWRLGEYIIIDSSNNKMHRLPCRIRNVYITACLYSVQVMKDAWRAESILDVPINDRVARRPRRRAV